MSKHWEDAELREVIENNETEKNIEEISEENINSSILGVVTECARLRVRKTPEVRDGNVILELPIASEVMVDLDNSTDDFYKITTAAGIEGYCMRNFINTEA